MKTVLIVSSFISVIFIIIHEYDAFYRGEWKMLGFLKRFSEKTQYRIFLWAHVPITIFCFVYMWWVTRFAYFPLWIGMNAFFVFHLFVHLKAVRWKENVFKSASSFLIIGGCGVAGIVNLALFSYYR
jgi:hypothetical protein